MFLEPIRQGWDDLLRVAATIDEGWHSATEVLYVLLVETQIDGVSALEWIRRPPGKRGAKTRALAIAKLDYLRTTFRAITLCKILIPPERLRAYARRLYRRRVDHAKEIAEPGRTLEVVGFIHTMLERQADRVLRMMVMAIARIWRHAHERAAAPRARRDVDQQCTDRRAMPGGAE